MNPGETIIDDKYQLRRQIATGGMGEVWEAERLGLHLKVAIKFLKQESVSTPQKYKRFMSEAKASGRIGHDNICEVLDFGVDQKGSPYYVMPLLRGCSLEEAIREDGPLSLNRVSDIGRQILAALSVAHAVGIIHRDLKPANIFLATIGDRRDFVKILDFGIAKFLTTSTDGTDPTTQAGSILGTPLYMSPEQVGGLKEIDGRLDIYAVGLILYEMLTHVHPFKRESLREIGWAILNAPIDPPRKFRKDIPPALEQVILQAMDRDPQKRFSTALVMNQALEEATSQAAPTPSSSAVQTADTMDDIEPMLMEVSQSGKESEVRPGGSVVSAPSSAKKRRGLSLIFVGVSLIVGVSALLAFYPSGNPETLSQEEVLFQEEELSHEKGIPDQINDERTSLITDASPSVPESLEEDSDGLTKTESSELTSQMVRVVLAGLPRKAKITLDGQSLEGPSFEIPARSEPVRIIITAPGYRRWEQRLQINKNMTHQVQMQRKQKQPAQAPPENSEKRPGLGQFGVVP